MAYDETLVRRAHERQGWSVCRSGITCRVHHRIGDALQVMIHLDAVARIPDVPSPQIEFVELRYPARAVNDEVGVDTRVTVCVREDELKAYVRG